MSYSRSCPGLQLLPRVMYEMVKQSLGNKSIKCVVDEDECIFTSDMEVLLSSLTLEHPAGELIYQALKSHKDQFGEGIRTHMFMITRLAKAVSQLEDLGIRSAASLAVVQEVISELVQQVHQISISIKSLQTTEVKSADPSKNTFPQMDDFNVYTATASRPMGDSSSEDSSTIFLRKSSSQNAPILFKDDAGNISETSSRSSKNSNNDQQAEFASFDYNYLSESFLREDSTLQPLDERNCFMNCNSAPLTHEFSDTVLGEHLVAEIVMECDPVKLKMSGLYPKDGCEEDNVDWFFDDHIVKNEDLKHRHQKSLCSANLEAEKMVDNSLDLSYPNNSESSSLTEWYQDSKDRQHSNLTDRGNQHDSDFEDCFDDLENRKQVLVVVERMEDFHINGNMLPFSQDDSIIMKSKMAHNIQKHFAPIEFDSVLDVPSLNDSPSDQEFSDCFDNAMGYNSHGKLFPDAFHKTQKCIEPHMNQSGSGLKQEKEILSLESSERSTSIPPGVTPDDETTSLSSASIKHSSELDKLKSILSAINVRKSQNVKEILVSSRHTIDEMYFEKLNDKIDIRANDNSEERLHCDLKSDAIKESKSPSLKAFNHETESNASIESTKSVNCKIIPSPLQKNNAGLKSTVSEKKVVLSSTSNANKSEIEKLNSVLSSVNVKERNPERRQIALSSRHGLNEDDLIRSCSSSQAASKDVTDLEKVNRSPEISTSCTFEKSSIRTVTDHGQHEEAFGKSGVESFRHGQFEVEIRTLATPTPDSHVTMDDVMLRKRRSLTFPVWLPSLTRGHEDVIELIESLYSSTTDSVTDGGKNIFNFNLTHCVSLQSPKSSRAIVGGLVIPCHSYNMDKLRPNFGCSLNILLINGDLTPSHRHKGYKPIIAKKNLIKSTVDIASQGKEALWASGLIDNMKQLNVSALFIRGNTTSIVSDACLSAGIVPLTNTSFHVLRIISQQMKIDMLCYADDASMSNVCKICLEPLNPSWMDVTEENHCLLVSNVHHVKSVVLSEPCALAAQISEEKFWKSFHRVSNAISDGMVLPGGGVTELWCLQQIKRMMSSLTDFRKSDEHLLKVTILETLADVFQDFVDTVKHNTGIDPMHQESHLIPNSDTCRSAGKSELDSFDHHLSLVHNKAQRKSFSCQKDVKNYPLNSNIEAMGTCLEPNSIYENIETHFDSFGSKISAWQSAVDVVSVVNSLDCLIITGASDKDLEWDGILL